MQLESQKLLEDVRLATEAIVEFTTDRTLQDYTNNAMLRSAVERQFEIIGEALNRLLKLDPANADRISDYQRIVAFRNMLIHGYNLVDDRLVWEIIQIKLPTLQREVLVLLAEY